MHAHVFQSAAFGTLHPLALLLCRRHGAACHGQPLLHDGRSATLHWVSSLTPPTQPDLRLRAAPRVAEAPMDTDSSADGVQQVGSGSRSGGKLKRAERESLQLLEWPALCRQVACFAQTSMGAELALAGRLPVGRSQSESETLLSETREAARMSLLFSGAFDLRQALDAAETDQVLHPLVLGAVATTLVTAEKLKEALAARGQHTAALQVLAAGIGDAVPELRTAIATCIQTEEGRILDAASPALSSVRSQRRENTQLLRRTADEWARTMFTAGAAERAQVVVRRDRLCVPLRAGRQGELPKGSVTLATSASGSTIYVEPAPLVRLNNAEAALAAAETEEEDRVLRELSLQVCAHAPRLRQILVAVAALDVACARARHAAWLHAVEPRFCSATEAAAHGPVHICGALHPLLLQPSLPPPPLPPLPAQGNAPEHSFGPLAALSMVPELWSRMGMAPAQPTPSGKSATPQQTSASGAAAQRQPVRPVAIDLTVPDGTKVAAVTGPNTGGKTASLKTLGLLSLMAKAGLFLPTDHSGAVELAMQPRLLWFDRVLADLGDGQSLQQSLSTFSGHVRRLRGVLREATPASLVLLDELGSGTDPVEGAALAAALLLRLSGSAALAYATTHHAELKELAASQPGFINASVEFDLATLRPTYRLLWGRAGESNALAVADGLGFSAAVVQEARQVAADLQAGKVGGVPRSATLQQSLEQQLLIAGEAAAAAGEQRLAAEAALAAAQHTLEAQQAELAKAADDAAAGKGVEEKARREAMHTVGEVRAGRLQVHEAEAQLKKMEREARTTDAAALTLMGLRADPGAALQPAPGIDVVAQGQWTPQQGESVRVRKMGGVTGVVQSAGGGGGGGRVSVRIGTMTVELRSADLEPATPGEVEAQERERRRQQDSKPATRAVRDKRRATGLQQSRSAGGGAANGQASAGVAIQTSANTADVRGMTTDDAVTTVEMALRNCRPGAVLFVVHGVGTGRVRAGVLAMLKRSSTVARTEEAEASKGGCTVVYVK